MIHRILIIFYLVFFTGFLNARVSANELFRDDFSTSSLDISKWSFLNETGVDMMSGSSLIVSPVDNRRSVFVINKYSLSDTDGIEYNIRFRFKDFWFGSGIAVNESLIPTRLVNEHPDSDDWTIFVWPTGVNEFKVFSDACLTSGACLPANNVLYTVSGSSSLDWHNLVINYSNGSYKVKLDDLTEKTTVTTSRPPNYVWFGNPMIVVDNRFSSLEVDYVYVDNLIVPSSFPYLSQKDTRWAEEEYDSASTWAGTDKKGIDRWGCALTSAAMILQEYGVKALDDTDIDPSRLNTWLKGQADGYIGPGLINWIAVTRYAKGRVPGEKDSLEFVRSYLPTAPILPAILGVPGHFIVAHDEDATNWKINDPASETNKTLAKTSTVKSINRFVPSSTDLSYMLLVKDPNITVGLTDILSNPIGLIWDEEYLEDDVEGGAKPSVFSAYVPKPGGGKYRLNLNNADTTPHGVTIYLYDTEGRVKKQEIAVNPGESLYEIDFDKSNVDESEIVIADTEAPVLRTKTNFGGWYNTVQTAYFTYSDPNLRDDYADPSCVIASEGKGQTCTINPNVCDKAGNCNTTTQTSNPANIDLTPPKPPKIVWVSDNWQRILIAWNPVRDSEKYVIYVGPKPSELSKVGETKELYWISQLMKPGKYYLAITSVDRAGNESPKSKVIAVNVIKRWRWWR